MDDFYTRGAYRDPDPGCFAKVKLTQPCPSAGHVSTLGVCVAQAPGKVAGKLWWPAVIAAVAWAAKHSPGIRADLREILRAAGE